MGRPRKPLIERLLKPVTVNADTGCWERAGHRVNGAYTQIGLGGTRPPRMYAHRASYEHFVGPIPEGLTLDHLCRNKVCINPEHLEPVTQAENTRRWAETITHCVHGHSLHDAYFSSGQRRCRTCNTARHAKWVEKNREHKRTYDRAWYAKNRAAGVAA